MTDLAIIILNYKTPSLLKKCLKSIFDSSIHFNYEVWVVDNHSEDDSAEMVKKNFPHVHLIESRTNLGFSGGNNLALKKAFARYYLLLNSDTQVNEGSIDSLVSFLENSQFDLASCRIVGQDGALQPNAGDLPFGLALVTWLFGIDDLVPPLKRVLPSFHQNDPSFYTKAREVGWVSGSVIIFSKKVLEKVGFWDQKIFMYGEDVDYCIRAKKQGFKIGWTPSALISHQGGGSHNDPHFNQWIGEFRGLLYLYQKYFGSGAKFFLKMLIYLFTFLRMVAFFIIGKPDYSKKYSKILIGL